MKDTPKTPKPTEPSVDVRDAWDDGFNIAKGMTDLFGNLSDSPEGITQESVVALNVIANQLCEHMKVVDAYFESLKETVEQ